MKRLIALGASIGLLAGLFTWFAGTVTSLGDWKAPFVVWVAFAAWACFYAAGGRTPGLVKTLAANASGVAWGWLIVWSLRHSGSTSPALLGLLVAVAAFAMCVQAGWAPLAFIPGTFVGAASYFGNAAAFWGTAVSLAVGALLAFGSELLGDVFERVFFRAHKVPGVEPVAPA